MIPSMITEGFFVPMLPARANGELLRTVSSANEPGSWRTRKIILPSKLSDNEINGLHRFGCPTSRLHKRGGRNVIRVFDRDSYLRS
jgi:hypothetical protein